MILWIQHEDHNAEDHEQSDDDNIQRNHDPKNGDTCYPGLGGWHSCFFGISFLAAVQGWEKMNPVFDFLKSGTETVCKWEWWPRWPRWQWLWKCDPYLVSLYDNGLSFPSHAAVNFIRHSHAHLVRPARQMERWKRPNDKRPNGERIREKVSPSDSGEHRGEFTDSILSDGGVEADHKVVLV